MSEADQDQTEKKESPPRPRWRKKRWRLLVVLILFLIWLDGPGWRWIGRKAALHFVPGISENLELEGRLTGGNIRIKSFDLEGVGKVAIALDEAELGYSIGELVSGKVKSLELGGLHVDVNLAVESEPEEEEEEDPDAEKKEPHEIIADLRERLVPMKIALRDASVRIHRDGEDVFTLAPTSITHESGEPRFDLSLGEMVFEGERKVEAQDGRLDWLGDSITLDRLEVMPALALEDLQVKYPVDDPLSFAVGLMVDGVRIDAETDLETVSLLQEDRPLDLTAAMEKLGFPIPAEVTLSSLELEARGLSGGIATLEADGQIGLADLSFEGWTSSRLALALKLQESSLNAVLRGEALGSPLELEAECEVSRADGLKPTKAAVDLRIPELAEVLTVIRDRFTPSEKPIAPPPSSLEGAAELIFSGGAPESANATINMLSSSEAPPIKLTATWQQTGAATAELEIPGVKFEGDFDQEQQTYAGEATLAGFDPVSLEDWLRPFGVELPTGMKASLVWSGSGTIPDQEHNGELEIESFEWQQEDQQALKAFASASYRWPEELSLTPLNLQQGAQKIEAGVTLKDQLLKLVDLSWSDGDDILLKGSASIPLPENPTDWKALLREERPIEVDLETSRVSLTKLHPYLPEEQRLRSDGAAQLDLKLTGTPADPVMDLELEAENLGLASKPDLPIAAINLQATGRGQTLKLEGEVTSPGYPAAEIDAVTNWDPDHWAEDPEVIKLAKIDASTTIKNFNLNLISKFVPAARKIEGNLNLDVEVTGTVGEPKPLAKITLDGGDVELKDSTLPRLRDTRMQLSASMEKVTLESLTADVSGGKLNLRGALDLKEGKPSALDFTIDGDELPVRRDDAMIVRMNTDISIRGPWENAVIGGNIGLIDSIFYKDIEILPIGTPFNQPSEPSLPALDAAKTGPATDAVPLPFRDWGLDMKLKTIRPFLIRGNLATGEVYLDVDVKGTIGKPRPSGDATLREIKAKLPFSTLMIREGKVTFRPDKPFNPTLNIRGESTIRPYEVNVYIYGPASDPKVLPTSNPPLPETEIMTLVATGTTTSGFEDPDAATARAAQLLIEEIRNGRVRYLNNLGPVLKIIEKVDFQVGEKDPYTSTKYNSATFNIDENWLVRAGISDEGNTRTTLIYLFKFR